VEGTTISVALVRIVLSPSLRLGEAFPKSSAVLLECNIAASMVSVLPSPMTSAMRPPNEVGFEKSDLMLSQPG
jgi:hypothetical protein